MDVAKYQAQFEDLLARLPGFLQDQIDEAKTHARDAGRAQRSLQFANDLKALNNNPFISGLYPFAIIGNDAPLTEEQISGVLADAKDFGLTGEVLTIRRKDEASGIEFCVLAFSHAAETYFSDLLGLRGIGYSNVDGNCLIMRGLTLLGLFSADEFTLRVFKKDAEKFLSARNPN